MQEMKSPAGLFELPIRQARTCLTFEGQNLSWGHVLKKRDAFLKSIRPFSASRPLIVWDGDNHPDAISLWMASQAEGLSFFPTRTAVLANRPSSLDRVDYLVFNQTGQAGFSPRNRSKPRLLHENELILPSSGTTGAPKFCRLSWPMIRANAEAGWKILNLNESDQAVISSSFQYTAGWNTLLTSCLLHDQPVELMRRFSPKKIVSSMHRNKSSFYHLSPNQANLVLAQAAWTELPPRSRGVVVIGSSDVYPKLIRSFCAKGFTVIRNYGLTEVGPFVFSKRTSPEDIDRQNLSELGALSEGLKCRVRRQVLELRGDAVFDGYFGDDAPANRDGWFRTGDLIRIEDGRMFFEGRAADAFEIHGRKIRPVTLERKVIEQFPGIREALITLQPLPGASGIRVRLRSGLIRSVPESDRVAGFVAETTGVQTRSIAVEYVRKLRHTRSGKLLRSSHGRE